MLQYPEDNSVGVIRRSTVSNVRAILAPMNDECQTSPKEDGQAFPRRVVPPMPRCCNFAATLRRRISTIELAVEFHREFNRMAKGGAASPLHPS